MPPSHSHSHPSIQSFFAPVTPTLHPQTSSSTTLTSGDGFTSSELAATAPSTMAASSIASSSSLHRFQPRATYMSHSIAELVPGPGCVKIIGRVVNLREIVGKVGKDGSSGSASASMHRAKGSWWCRVGDGTGIVTVCMLVFRPQSLVGKSLLSIFLSQARTSS